MKPEDDLISRQALCEYALNQKDKSITPNDIMRFPSAQPEKRTDKCTETHACDSISRQAAIEALIASKGKDPFNRYEKQNIGLDWGIEALKQLPSAQPEHTNSWYINSWCVGCKEYDHERKCCPRYNRVIRQTLDEAYAHGEAEAEYRFHKTEKRCDTCRHEKSQWFNRCADCFEYELWEKKE